MLVDDKNIYNKVRNQNDTVGKREEHSFLYGR